MARRSRPRRRARGAAPRDHRRRAAGVSPEADGGRPQLGLADTSLFIAPERDRPLSGSPPERIAVSVITVGELRLGVLVADDGPTRARRLETLTRAEALEP